MDQATQSPTDNKPFIFRVKQADKQTFMRELGEDLHPFKFITVEKVEGDDLIIMVIPASLDPIVRAKLADLGSRLSITAHADSPAADRWEDLAF